MQKDERDLLELLKFELEFLEKGGYGRSPREPWRPLFIFEDSPTCMNYDSKEHPAPCSECALMHLVPPALRSEKTPCRHIPLNEAGETLDSLYRWSEQAEVEETVDGWLKTTIAKLEQQRRNAPYAEIKPAPLTSAVLQGTALHESLHPKCANPACPTAFHWLGGGKFFRFRPEPSADKSSHGTPDPPSSSPKVKHYWLCENCSHMFSLAYDNELGVVLTLQRTELPSPEVYKSLPVA